MAKKAKVKEPEKVKAQPSGSVSTTIRTIRLKTGGWIAYSEIGLSAKGESALLAADELVAKIVNHRSRLPVSGLINIHKGESTAHAKR